MNVQTEIKKLGELDEAPDYKEKLENFRRVILKKCDKSNYNKTKKIISKAIDKTLEDIEQNPQSSKSALLFVNMELAKQASLYLAADDVEKLNLQLMNFQNIANFARKLNVPKDSTAYTELQNYITKLDELENFAKAHTRRYENIGMTTAAYDTLD